MILNVSEKEFSIDAFSFEGHHVGLIELKSFIELIVRLRSTATSLKKRVLVDILELKYISYEDNYYENSDSANFVGEVLKLLQCKSKREQADMEKLSDQPKDIKQHKEELLKEKCKEAEIGC